MGLTATLKQSSLAAARTLVAGTPEVTALASYIETRKAVLSAEDLKNVTGGKGAEHTQVRAQYLVFSVQEATVFTTTSTMLEAEVVLIAT